MVKYPQKPIFFVKNRYVIRKKKLNTDLRVITSRDIFQTYANRFIVEGFLINYDRGLAISSICRIELDIYGVEHVILESLIE